MSNARPTETEAKANGLYAFLWRWHFYGGLFTAPFLVMLAVTGALYLFDNEIESRIYAPLMKVEAGRASMAPGLQEAAVLARYPGAKVRRYAAPVSDTRAAEWSVTTSTGERLVVFVDPADARVLGALSADWRLMDVVARLHGELMIGRTGDLLVELAASWALVLVVTGAFLWWPRKGRKVGVVRPRLKASPRAIARDWHAVPMAWSAPVLVFLILSGLPWSGFWGDNLAKLGTVEAFSAVLGPSPNFTSAPRAPSPAHSEHQETEDLPWAVRPLPIPEGTTGAAPMSIDGVVTLAAARGIHQAGLRVIYPSGVGGVFTLSFVPDRAEDQRTVHVNPADGTVLQDIAWPAYTPLGKAVEFGVMTHMGRQFGPLNQWVLLVFCLFIVLAVGFGIAAWWMRRPRGQLGVPPSYASFRPHWAVYVVAAALGILFPLAGASMIVMLAIDTFLVRRGKATLS